jgi:hypothetical protein
MEEGMGERPAPCPPVAVPVVQRDGARVTVGIALEEGIAKVTFAVAPGDHQQRTATFRLLPPVRDTGTAPYLRTSAELAQALDAKFEPEFQALYADYRARMQRWGDLLSYERYRDKYGTSHFKKAASTLNASFSGGTLVSFLNQRFTNSFSWLSVFRVLYPLVADKENDIAATMWTPGMRREVEKIVRLCRENSALSAAASTAGSAAAAATASSR